MTEVNPYRLQYIPAPDHSKELYDQMVAPIARQREQQESDRTNAYRNASLQRETDRDVRNDERERIGQQQRAREMLSNDRRAGQREDLYALAENRRESADQLSRQHLTQQEHEKLIQELYNASNTGDPRAVQFAIDALSRAGYPVEEIQHTQTMPEAPAQPVAAAPAPIAPVKPVAPKAHVSSVESAALDRQLNAADKKYSKGLGASPWLPGKNPVQRQPTPEVAQSDAMLSPDDPYNQLVK